jgi:hypothetical protein
MSSICTQAHTQTHTYIRAHKRPHMHVTPSIKHTHAHTEIFTHMPTVLMVDPHVLPYICNSNDNTCLAITHCPFPSLSPSLSPARPLFLCIIPRLLFVFFLCSSNRSFLALSLSPSTPTPPPAPLVQSDCCNLPHVIIIFTRAFPLPAVSHCTGRSGTAGMVR